MNLLLTGASGFLGRNVLMSAPRNWHILALYHNDQRFPDFVTGLNNPNITISRCDLTDSAQVSALLAKHGRDWECCLHLAAVVDIPWSVREPAQDLVVNTAALITLLDCLRVRRFVYFSSGAVYEGLTGEVRPEMALSPTLPYAISKLASEHYVRCYAIRRHSIDEHVIVRFFGAYGPYEAPHKIYTRLVRTFALERKTAYTVYGDGQNLIDAMYVDDAVEAIRHLLVGTHYNCTINLAGGNPLTIECLVRQAGSILGAGMVDVCKSGVAHEHNRFWGCTRGMRELFGFEPRTRLAEGLSQLRSFLWEEQEAENQHRAPGVSV